MSVAYSAFLGHPVLPGFDDRLPSKPQDVVPLSMPPPATPSLAGYLPTASLTDFLPAASLAQPFPCASLSEPFPCASLPGSVSGTSMPDLLCSPLSFECSDVSFPHSDSDSANDLNSSPASNSALPSDLFGDLAGPSPLLPALPISPVLDESSGPVDFSSMMFPEIGQLPEIASACSTTSALSPFRNGACAVPPPYIFGSNPEPLSNISPTATNFTPCFDPGLAASPTGTQAVSSPDASPCGLVQAEHSAGATSPFLQSDGPSSSMSVHVPRSCSTEAEPPRRSHGRHRRTQSDITSKAEHSSAAHAHSQSAATRDSRGQSTGRASRLGTFICRSCGRRFNRYYNLAAHSLIHDPNQPRPYICPAPNCHKAFARKYDARRHFTKLHVNPSDCPAKWIDLIVDTRATGTDRKKA